MGPARKACKIANQIADKMSHQIDRENSSAGPPRRSGECLHYCHGPANLVATDMHAESQTHRLYA